MLIPYGNALELVRLIPGASLATMPGGGHDLPLPWCAELSELMASHFNGTLPAGHRTRLSEAGQA